MVRTFERFTLNQIQVVRLLQNTALESTAQPFQIATIDIEQKVGHFYDFGARQALKSRERAEKKCFSN